MFSWFRRKPAPTPPNEANPGVGPRARVTLAYGGRPRSEEVDVLESAARVLRRHGHTTKAEGTCLEVRGSGLILRPQIVDAVPLERGGVRTVTTVEIRHPAVIPHGVFEFQHAAADSAPESVTQGLDQWVRTDFLALLDSLRPKPEVCMCLEMEFPESDGRPTRTRRAILGPVTHYATQSPGSADPEGHPFCSCCLLTRSFEAFKPLFEADVFFGLRLFASRGTDGMPEADCRVNGEDWEAGALALREYVTTWPGSGFEFRKQYVILQTIAGSP